MRVLGFRVRGGMLRFWKGFNRFISGLGICDLFFVIALRV